MPRPQDTFAFAVAATALLLGLAAFLLMFIRAYLRNRRQLIHENTLQAERHRQALLETRLEIQEETVRHIGRELHDNIGQIASLMKANLAVLQLRYDGQVAIDLEETVDLLRALIGDVRQMSASLSGADLKTTDLPAALQRLAASAARSSNKEVAFVQDDTQPILDPTHATIIYRIVQEGLSNAVKHSRATHIRIGMARGADGTLILSVTDNGSGFDAAHAAGDGNGLRNLKERAALLRADLRIATADGQGTTITLTLPNPTPDGTTHA